MMLLYAYDPADKPAINVSHDNAMILDLGLSINKLVIF